MVIAGGRRWLVWLITREEANPLGGIGQGKAFQKEKTELEPQLARKDLRLGSSGARL